MAFYFTKQQDTYGSSLKHKEDLERARGACYRALMRNQCSRLLKHTHTHTKCLKGQCEEDSVRNGTVRDMDVGKSLHKHRDFVLVATSQKPLDLTHLNATAAEDQGVERFQVF